MNRSRCFRFESTLLIVAVLACLLPDPAASQVLYGTILGNVRDKTRGSVPGASVTITSKDTGLTRQTKTTEAGFYIFSDVQAGTYTVQVTHAGFRTSSSQGVPVTINTVSRLDVDLEVGAVAETVEVSAQAVSLQTDKADVHVEFSRKISELPLPQYRNYQTLFLLVPGAVPPRFQNAVMDAPGRALTTEVNGTIRNTNFTRSDGASNIQAYLRHHTVYVEPVEAIETVSIVTNNFDAEQGLAGGAAINVVTKSGTNDLHLTAFEFHDNQHLRARNFFNTGAYKRTPGKSKSINNIYGVTVGGPIKENKMFFFTSWEATRERVGFENANLTVPTATMRNGDFRSFGTNIYDPLTGDANGRGRSPFANNIVPLARHSQISRKLQDLIPLPSLPGEVSNLFNSGPQVLDRDNGDLKLNWNQSERLQIWGKYSISYATVNIQPALGPAGGPGLGSGGNGNSSTQVQVGTIGYTWTLTPRLLVDGNVGFSRFGQYVLGPEHGKNIGLDVLGIPGTNGPDIRQSGFPIFSIAGFTTLGNPDNWSPLFRNDNTYSHTTNLGWTRGQHDVRFGFDLRRFHVNHWQPEVGGGPRGRFNYTGGIAALNGGASPNSFNTWAAFLLGLPNSMQKSLQYFAPMGTREWQMGWYARDRWQASRALTVTLGVRYEYFPLMTRPWSGIERYDIDTNKVLVGRFGGVPDNAGTTLSKRLFAPRLGLAYRAKQNTVIRAGYGITYIPDLMSAMMRSPYPVVIAQDFLSPNAFQPFRPIEQGIPALASPDFRAGIIDIPNSAQTAFLPKGKLRQGYIQSWNLTVERQLPAAIVLDVAYVGTGTVRSYANWDQNAGFPGSGTTGRPLVAKFGRTVDTNLLDGLVNSNYHSLQVSVNRRFIGGFYLKGAYTIGKAINMQDGSGSDAGGTTLGWNHVSVLHRNRAIAGYDRTHNLQMAGTYDLPFGPGKKWLADRGAGGVIARDWQVNWILSSYTGTPFTVGAAGASLDAPRNTQTADQVKPVVSKLGAVGNPELAFYDPTAFRAITEVRYGTSGRNILRGPGLVNLGLGLFRNVTLTERWKMQFRAEAFNLGNTPHFGNPGANVSNAQFNADGTVRALRGFMAITGAVADERQLRFGLRVMF